MKEKDGDYALYKGIEYQAYFDYQIDKLVLVSHNQEDLKKGFTKYDNNDSIFLKNIDLHEADDGYNLTTKAIYKGKEVGVARINEAGEIVIFHGDQDFCKNNQFSFIEPGVWEKVVKVEELDKIWQHKSPRWGF
ncbi:hypothetical protein V7138_15745 [Bacillus sp. JJ1533]|uniref:hypothetical protein n=1 Tax=Bacillus sp. JJ1533 TaxID=3122959 RepID=UPI003000D41D